MSKFNETEIANHVKKELYDIYLDNINLELYQQIDKIEENAKNFITNTGIFITFILTIIFSGLPVIANKIIGCIFWIILSLFIGYIILLCFSIISATYCINIKIKTLTTSVSEKDILEKINSTIELNPEKEKELEKELIDMLKTGSVKNPTDRT